MGLLPAERNPVGGDTPPWRRGVQLQGPRPPPLSVSRESRKIRKPPKAATKPPKPVECRATTENRGSVVIYAVSPKTITIDASEFKSIVQRLTGLGSTATPSSLAGGSISPAARIAAIEKASPTGRERERERTTMTMSSELDLVGTVDLAQIPGILSLAPANLPDLPAEMFSPDSSGFFTGGVGPSPTPSPVLDFSAIFNS